MSDDSDAQAVHYEIVMPFTVCRSQGGPYDDESFCAGFQAAQIQAVLRSKPPEHSAIVRTALVPQLDLIAMDSGYALLCRQWREDDEWTFAEFAVASQGSEQKT